MLIVDRCLQKYESFANKFTVVELEKYMNLTQSNDCSFIPVSFSLLLKMLKVDIFRPIILNFLKCCF